MLRRFKSCPSYMSRIDPKPFYQAVMTSYELADERLVEHPIDHRPGLTFRAAFDTITRYFSYQSPGVFRRASALHHFVAAWGDEPIDIVVDYIDVAFHPGGSSSKRLASNDMQLLGHTGLKIPSVLAPHITWGPGELDRHIDRMCTFDHTQFPR